MTRRAAAFSFLLHVVIIAIIIIGIPYIPQKIPEDAPIPMEIVTVADKTTQLDKAPQPPTPAKPQEKPPEPQQAQPKPTPAPTPPAPPPPAPQQQAETKPTPQPEKAPEPKAEPLPLPKPKPEPTPPKAPEQVSQPQQKFADAKPQKKPQPTKDDFLNNVLKDVAPPKVAQNDAPKQPVKNPSSPPPAPKASTISDQLTMSEIDFIRRQYIQCWNPPAGARDAENLVVDINVDYNPDGSVRHAEIAPSSRSDTFYRTAAESALRAVLNPQCNPLKAPPAKYDVWKSVTLSFNPKDLFGT
jgi:hypothetical protein